MTTGITGPRYRRFSDAYLAVLGEIRNNPQFTTSTRAKDATEIINVSFTIDDPTDRTPYLRDRMTNIVFNHAETLWYLTGRDDLDMIAHYAPTLRKLSSDGQRLTGTAYGPRLFAPAGPDGLSQFDRVLRLLAADPDAKRAAMTIMRPDELVDMTNPDVACTLGLHLMLRQGRLHMGAYMRGNDAVIGLLGDTFAFTFIQEYAARLLGVQVGTYGHHVGSMHINVLDGPKVDRILAAGPTAEFQPARMPDSTTRADLAQVATWEERLRANSAEYTPDLTPDLHDYWREIIALFEVHRQLTYQDGPVSGAALDALRGGHRWLVQCRWPDRMPQQVSR